MYPAQTSLIPVTIAIARFIESNGFSSLFGWYPYWYLGVPARFLAGPVVPIFLALLHRLLPNVSLFSISIFLILLSFLIGALGWGILASKISKKRKIGILTGFLLLILPWRYLSSFALDEASFVISRNLLPFALIAFWNFLSKRTRKAGLIALIAISFLLLINTSILAILIVGISALVLALSFKKGRIKKISKYIKLSLLILTLGLGVVTFWYTLSYWLVTLTNPSIGGAAGYKVIFKIFDLLRASLPFLLAVFAVYFSSKIKDRFTIFGLTWALTFLFLTTFRFFGDPDFWQDWTSWLFEGEVGVALLISKPIFSVYQQFRAGKDVLFINKKIYFVLLILLGSPFLLTNYIYQTLRKPILLSSSKPLGISGLINLAEVAKDERVFISGSTVFWADALSNLAQVRGGVDKVATHPFWDHAAYQLREGDDSRLAQAWLEALGVSYVLIHGPYSFEAYHDFRNIDKWAGIGEVVWEGGGDIIIRIPQNTLAWIVDLNRLKKAKSPKNGKDLRSLNRYLLAKKGPIKVIWDGPNRVLIESEKLKENEGIILAVTYDSSWKSRNNIDLKKDLLGNILITVSEKTTFPIILEYK